MEDIINSQAAINALMEEFKRTPTIAIRAKYTIEQLPPAQSEQQWIPISEGLPKEKDAGILNRLGIEKRSEYVLATVEVKGKRMTVTACTYDGVWHWDKKYAFPNFKVIAWMPLPEPYQGGKDE